MIAFVLSGGASRGALQVGALQALLAAGVVPDMLVGSSVGAINGAYMAYNPTIQGAEELGEIWADVTRADLYPGNHLTALWSVLRGKESLFTNAHWYRFLERHIPCRTFADLPRRCFVTATEYETGKPHFFGEDPSVCILDALMASCALPPLHPPYAVGGKFYLDGGTTVNLPLRYAVSQGATQVYTLNIVGPPPRKRHLVDVSARAIETLVQHQIHMDLEHCATQRHVRVRQFDLRYEGDLEPWDFSRTAELVAGGRAAAEQLLAQEPPHVPTWQERLAACAEASIATAAQAATNLVAPLWPKGWLQGSTAVQLRTNGD